MPGTSRGGDLASGGVSFLVPYLVSDVLHSVGVAEDEHEHVELRIPAVLIQRHLFAQPFERGLDVWTFDSHPLRQLAGFFENWKQLFLDVHALVLVGAALGFGVCGFSCFGGCRAFCTAAGTV